MKGDRSWGYFARLTWSRFNAETISAVTCFCEFGGGRSSIGKPFEQSTSSRKSASNACSGRVVARTLRGDGNERTPAERVKNAPGGTKAQAARGNAAFATTGSLGQGSSRSGIEHEASCNESAAIASKPMRARVAESRKQRAISARRRGKHGARRAKCARTAAQTNEAIGHACSARRDAQLPRSRGTRGRGTGSNSAMPASEHVTQKRSPRRAPRD